MESVEEIIKIKVRNTLVLKNISPEVLAWVKDREKRQPPFKGHYDDSEQLINDLKLVEDLTNRKSLIEWLKSKHTRNPVIVQTVTYFENKKT
jgi:hypothetical protein